ncbi:hypothetical protein [Bradyrhizobium sp. JR3.5]
MKLISAFGAADMLELDRQTVRRALRHVAPDGHENEQPRWRLKTIIDAIDRHLGRNNGAVVPTATGALNDLFEAFDTGCRGLDSLPDLEARRREAQRLMVVLVELDAAMRADARARREDELRASLRCDEHFRLAMRNFERPCEWTLDECWAVLAEVE